jgi:hypothetical protein
MASCKIPIVRAIWEMLLNGSMPSVAILSSRRKTVNFTSALVVMRARVITTLSPTGWSGHNSSIVVHFAKEKFRKSSNKLEKETN